MLSKKLNPQEKGSPEALPRIVFYQKTSTVTCSVCHAQGTRTVMRQIGAGSGPDPRLSLLDSLDMRAQPRELLVDGLVSAVDVVNPVHFRHSVCNKPRKHQGR